MKISNFNLKKCEYSSFEIDAVCPKCGDGNLVKRNKKRNNEPFICCEMYECDFYLEFKNPIWRHYKDYKDSEFMYFNILTMGKRDKFQCLKIENEKRTVDEHRAVIGKKLRIKPLMQKKLNI